MTRVALGAGGRDTSPDGVPGPWLTCTHPRLQRGLFHTALKSTAPGASCSPVASFSLQRRTPPPQRLWSQCSWPAEGRGLAVCSKALGYLTFSVLFKSVLIFIGKGKAQILGTFSLV